MFGLEHSLIDQLKHIFACHPEIERVVIFGSRAKGTYRTGSDIDLCIELTEVGSIQAGQLADDIDQLNSPYLFDLVYFQKIQNPALIQHIQDVGQELYVKDRNQRCILNSMRKDIQ